MKLLRDLLDNLRAPGQRLDARLLLCAHDVLFAVGLERASLWCLLRAAWRWDWRALPGEGGAR